MDAIAPLLALAFYFAIWAVVIAGSIALNKHVT